MFLRSAIRFVSFCSKTINEGTNGLRNASAAISSTLPTTYPGRWSCSVPTPTTRFFSITICIPSITAHPQLMTSERATRSLPGWLQILLYSALQQFWCIREMLTARCGWSRNCDEPGDVRSLYRSQCSRRESSITGNTDALSDEDRVARDGIEPPTPAFSARDNGLKSRDDTELEGRLFRMPTMAWAVFGSSRYAFCARTASRPR